MLVGQTAGVGRQVCLSVKQLGYSACTNFLDQEVMTPTPLDLEVMGLKPGSPVACISACLH